MKVYKREFGSGINVLKFDHFVSIPITIDFSKVTTEEGNLKVVKAGTPIADKGLVATTTSGASNAIGILMHNVYEDNPNTALIIHGFIDKAKAETNMGSTYDEETMAALPMVQFL